MNNREQFEKLSAIASQLAFDFEERKNNGAQEASQKQLKQADLRKKGVPTKRANSVKRVPLPLRTLEGTLLILRNLGYSYVVEKDGEAYKHGIVSIPTASKVTTTKKKKTYKYPKGYLKDFIEPQMKNMKVNDLLEISNKHPDGTDISLYSLQSGAGNAAGKFWGIGSVTTSMNPKNKTVEVLRLF